MPLRDLALIIVICLAWAFNYIVGACGMQHFSPFTFMVIRFVIVLLVVGPYLQLIPLFGVVFGILVWGDRPGSRLYIGGSVLLLGILIITLRARKKMVL